MAAITPSQIRSLSLFEHYVLALIYPAPTPGFSRKYAAYGWPDLSVGINTSLPGVKPS